MGILKKFREALRGVDRRELQYEIDMHRLFLLTSYHKQGDGCLDEVSEKSSKLSIKELQTAVNDNVYQQLERIAEAMDEILLPTPHKKMLTNAEMKEVERRPSGLSFAVGREPPKPKDPETLIPLETRTLSSVELSSSLKDSISYTLGLKPSQINHKDAGLGVHLSGRVGPGTVVSLYPGIVYTPSQYRYMRGYPRMDAVNSYLVARYDGLVIDGQFWGQGDNCRLLWDGKPREDQCETTENSSMPDKKRIDLLGSLFGAKDTHYARKGSIVERRNPLALGHFVNHPAKGKAPNVMLCPFDFVFGDPYMRPYIPNVHFDHDDDKEMTRQGLVWTYDQKKEDKSRDDSRVIRTLVLLSTAEICDEELFLNYRLSNHSKWPPWYHPVDLEEDKRRWY